MTKQFLNFERTSKEIDLIKVRIETCEKHEWAKIKILRESLNSSENKLETSFEALSKKENEDNSEAYLKYKGILWDLKIELEEKSEGLVTNIEKSSQNKVDSNVGNFGLRIPECKIATYFGDAENWVSFRELFTETILKNSQLSKIQKLQYLHASVRGDAAKLIRGFPLKEENLDNCWEILCNRYENKLQLAISQLNKIFNIKIQKANNSKTLLELLDTCNESVRNLKTLGLDSNNLTDLILIRFMLSKLEDPLKQRWELTQEANVIPTLDSFRKFIEREARSMQEARVNKSDSKFNLTKKPFEVNTNKKHIVNSTLVKNVNNSVTKQPICLMCKKLHPLYKCETFNSKPVSERWNFVEIHKLCANCLRQNHLIEDCKITIACKNCGEKHHTLLHMYYGGVNQNTSVSNSSQCFSSNVLLSTALIRVVSDKGKVINCKALIDNASQNSLITKDCAKRLGLPLRSTSHSLIGVNCIQAETALSQTEFYVSPHFSSNSLIVNAFVVKKITSPLPNFHLKNFKWPHIEGLQLADPHYYLPGPVDLLLGADIYARICTGPPILGPPGTPTAIPTQLGYILLGQILQPTPHTTTSVCNLSLDSELNKTLKTFFELEAVPQAESQHPDTTEEFYSKTVKRQSDGRYSVRLPFKEPPDLGNSYNGALTRFQSMEKKIHKNETLGIAYVNFMHEYQTLGHMTQVKSPPTSDSPGYFLPHHAVFNDNSLSTKIRVVFDASFKTSNKKSLNDILLIGPKLQTNIFDHLLRFRSYPIAFTADIEKMYRQILIDEEDRKYQQIFWRNSPQESLAVYTLNTVTYGSACAPFLALRTLKQLCLDEKFNFPLATKIANDHFYVDDLLAGAESIEEASELVFELRELMSSGGFPLKKWASNDPSVLSNIPDEDKTHNYMHFFDEHPSQRVLGIFWCLQGDTIKVRTVAANPITSKRELLSVIAKIYDPLGIVAPSTLTLKLFLQEMWKTGANWDDPLPEEIAEQWETFRSEIQYYNDMSIPRFFQVISPTKIELHGFCDASQKAYAAVAYLRVVNQNISVSLIACKTRVAPVKHVTLPRLELCGAQLLSELTVAIQRAVTFEITEIVHWCDSSIVLSWINNPPTKGNQFVTHRVAKIHSLTSPETWRHISGKLNPADCATRGLTPLQLKNKKEWWEGPSFLYDENYSSSFTTLNSITVDTVPQDQDDPSINLQLESPLLEFDRFSSFNKITRTMAWVLRFIHNLRNAIKQREPLNATELSEAELFIVKMIQKHHFSNEIKSLSEGKCLKSSNHLVSLDIFLDPDGVIRVGGRLRQHELLSFDAKHPILLPKSHPFTLLIIRKYHEMSAHAGPNLVLALIRQKYWIPHGRSTIRKEIHRCILCARLSARSIVPPMGNLPKARITQSRPFSHVGMDFAGPITTKCQHTRKANTFKSYLCLFICMATKATHLELVSDLSTNAFLAALRRFIGRRGCPSDIYSDNGRNFVGAQRYLRSLFQLPTNPLVQDFASQRGIFWHFIPPYAPNFGGLWESSIKLAKNHLIKITKGFTFNFEEMQTLLCQVEAIINSRPLIPLSTNPNDLQALTPGHFIIGAPLLEMPESNHCAFDSALSLSCRYRHILEQKDKFWQRWTVSYLNSLQTRPTTSIKANPLKEGELVLIKDKSVPPLRWNLGRIHSLIKGKDNIIRVVDVKTTDGIIRRLTSSIVRLPVDQVPGEGAPSSSTLQPPPVPGGPAC